jgi:hypothetical protein
MFGVFWGEHVSRTSNFRVGACFDKSESIQKAPCVKELRHPIVQKNIIASTL